MEEMEVDLGLGGIAGTSGQDEAESIIIPDSGSSTEVEEDEDEDPEPHDPQLLMNSWAFSQRIEAQFRALAESPSSLAFRRSTARPDGRHQSTLSQPPHFMLRMPLVPQSDMTDILEVGGTREEESGQEERGVTAELGRSAVLTAPPGSTEAADTPLVQILPQNPAASDGAVAMGTGDAPPIADVKSEPSQSAEASQAAGSKEEEEGDTEGENCSICFEPWTTAGDHRLSTLRCGHLFGFSCIRRWLKGQGAKCPQCNKKAKRSDIVLLYAHRLRVLDNSEQESVKRSLEQEQSLRRKAELESAQCRLQLQVLTDECGKLRRQLQELKSLMAQTGSLQTPGPSQTSLSQHPDASGSTPASGHYVFAKAVMLSQAGGCRVLSYCEPLSCLLASQPSPQATLVPGCGVKKVSVVNLKACQYVPIHAKQIRGLAFNRQADSLLLSAALDNTVKLTSLLTNMVVQTYNAGRPVWSCCWCLDNNNYVFAGLNNGSVLVYDTRDTSTHVQELVPLGSRCPVASLSYVPRAASSSFPCGGLIAGSLDGACFWEQVDSSMYRPHVLPLETGGCTDIQVEPESRHCLVTYRPGRSNPNLRCVLMELNRTPQVDSTQEPTCFCCPVQTFSAGSSCKLLTKNAVFRNPAREGSMLVCAGDESSNSTMVWDVGSGALIQKLPADLPVLDICPFEVNQGSYLASLTEKMLKIYKWE